MSEHSKQGMKTIGVGLWFQIPNEVDAELVAGELNRLIHQFIIAPSLVVGVEVIKHGHHDDGVDYDDERIP